MNVLLEALTSVHQTSDRLQRLSRALNRSSRGSSDCTMPQELPQQDAKSIRRRRADALVEVVITFGTACSNGVHGEDVFHTLRTGLENRFDADVFVLAREEPLSFSCFTVHVNNVLVFGCQGRRPTVDQLCTAVESAMSGRRPELIPYSQAIVCEFFGACKKHKYLI